MAGILLFESYKTIVDAILANIHYICAIFVANYKVYINSMPDESFRLYFRPQECCRGYAETVTNISQ